MSSVGLKFRGRQATSIDVVRALEPVHSALKELADKNALDEKLAEYVFFPLSHIFNETQRISAHCLELAVNSLCILIVEGWRQHLSPAMGKQLIILLTLIVGGVPKQQDGKQPSNTRPEELVIAGFECFTAIFNTMGGPLAERTIYNEIGTATVVDQTVYVLLEAVEDSHSEELCLAAAKALQALYLRITDRVVLASIMPRTVSALTKTLKPTTQVRRSYRLLVVCLQVLSQLLKAVLNDHVVCETPNKPLQPQISDGSLVLDESWLNATATQVKLALANVIQIRRHERPEVQAALLQLCLMVIEDCQNALKDSIPIMVETIVVLSDFENEQTPNEAYSSLTHLTTTYPVILDSLKDSLNNWLTSFPRTMQSNDETSKQWGIKQISTVFQVLSQVQSESDLLTAGLASGLCDSVAVALSHTTNTLQPLESDSSKSSNLEVINHSNRTMVFPSILMEHRSQQQTLKDLRSMITKLNFSDSGIGITSSILSRMRHAPGNSIIAPFWLALTFLNGSSVTAAFDDFISADYVEHPISQTTKSSMIEDLYFISLPILNEPLLDDSRDWRVSALALEAVALQAQQLGEGFRPELIDALYPVLQLLASNNPSLQEHAMICLNVLTTACNYTDTSTMIIENVDYLVNAVALKLNTFDVSPYPPQVLFMMVKLCGAGLIPYLDDLIKSIFGILDMYHGYPRLVEMMFKTLSAVVEEGAKIPSFLAITDGKASDHHKQRYEGLSISTLANDIASRRSRRLQSSKEATANIDDNITHPERPWTLESEGFTNPKNVDLDPASDFEEDEPDKPLPERQEPEDGEKPLSTTHSLLLQIIKSIPSHLSSPSPYLRRSLLAIIIQIFPVIAESEDSFLPLINDLWPSVISRISFPSASGGDGSSPSTNIIKKEDNMSGGSQDRAELRSDEFETREETYVITTACDAITIMCRTAGDFMATRVENEYPRWERLYRRAWERVRQDAEKSLARRAAAHQAPTKPNPEASSGTAEKDLDTHLSLLFSQPLSLTTTTKTPAANTTASTFTPHHSLWRSLTALFITILTHVRLPLSIGDQICEFLGAWIARYAGPEYYFRQYCRPQGHQTGPRIPDTLQTEAKSVDNVIRAMETWNADLAWFIFQQQRVTLFEIINRGKDKGHTGLVHMRKPVGCESRLVGGKLRFADVVF